LFTLKTENVHIKKCAPFYSILFNEKVSLNETILKILGYIKHIDTHKKGLPAV